MIREPRPGLGPSSKASSPPWLRNVDVDGSCCLLEGSWVVISGVISPLIWVVSRVTLLITPRITTYEPPSKVLRAQGFRNPWLVICGRIFIIMRSCDMRQPFDLTASLYVELFGRRPDTASERLRSAG